MTMILLRSPKGGVGTTFLTARLAIALAARGYEVSAVDGTTQDSLKLYFELSPTQSLDVLEAGVTPDAISGVQLFRADPDLDAQEFADLLAAWRAEGHICLVDIGTAGSGRRSQLLAHADLEICTLVPSPIALATLTQVDPDEPVLALKRTAFVLNQLDDRRRLSNDIHKLVRTMMGDQLLGTVRRDEAVSEALAAMKPLPVFAPASAALHDIERLTDLLIARIGLPSAQDLREAAA
jgi:cellulose biosynthesis protein BcsQ